jgi:mRNA (2'-O-methyladenosine-N6-)-methyltransferase
MQSPDSRFQPICKRLTMEECASALKSNRCCDDVHFKVIYYPQTDPSLGYCSYLNTCHRTSRCKYLHFQPIRHPDAPPFEWKTIYDDDPLPIRTDQPYAAAGSEGSNLYGYAQADLAGPERLYLEAPIKHPSRALYAHGLQKYTRQSTTGDDTADLMPPQWIDADLKNFDYSILGKFDVIVADPPWDIHMSLPYGTMSDDDMRAMPFPQLQEEGFLFLWVTGRAMELGRELLAFWNYTRLDELIWVKVGQTQRLIRTGRTGHWLNHSKEHLLIGVKRKTTSEDPLVSPLTSLSTTYSASHAPGLPASCLIPEWANTGLDADVIVAEVRDTSRKPDELYSIIERLCPKGRKVELFGRRHNSRPGWITVGNQLKGDNIVDEELKRKVASWRNNNHSVSYS